MKRFIGVFLLSLGLIVGQADAKSYGSGGGSPVRSSSPSRSTSSPRPAPSPRSSSSSSTSTKHYGSGGGVVAKSSPVSTPSYSAPSSFGSKPVSNPGFAGSQSQKEQHSAQAYARANPPPAPTPRSSYTDARGQTRTINTSDSSVSYLRGRLDGERYANRSTRVYSYYGSRYDYYRSRPVVIYSSLFYYWLLDQPYSTRGDYVYHHRYDMDPARYAYYMSDPMVASRVHYLESVNFSRNPYWAPTGWDYDGMLDDNYVASVYNPAPTPTYDTPVSYNNQPAVYYGPSRAGHYFLWTFIWLVIGIFVIAGIYAVFMRQSY